MSVLLVIVLGMVAGMFLPWWSIAVVAFLVGVLMGQSVGLGFLSGFLGVFLLWGCLAIWIDVKNQSILSHKVAALFPLGGSSFLLILVTAFVGALVGGFAALSGSALRPRKVGASL